MPNRITAAIAAFSSGLAVILGALAAHALYDALVEAGNYESWKTAAFYHLTHSITALILAWHGFRRCAWAMLVGILLFSGSIYILCLVDGVSWLGPVTPLGGLLLIISWFALGFSLLKAQPNAQASS